MRTVLIAVLATFLAAPVARAQSATEAPASAEPPSAPAQTGEQTAQEVTTTPSANGAQEAASAPPADAASVGLLQGRLDALEEQYAETRTDVLAAKQLKLSGYVQARFQDVQTSVSGADAKGTPLVVDGFTVRRGRLKATYSSAWAQFVLQIDATPKGVTLKDAEAHLVEPWTGHKLALVAGQTKWPFGYEVAQSSSDREFPERTRVVRAFAAGERDRGAKLVAKVGVVRFSGGVFDGNGIENKGFVGVDNDRRKDVVGRLGVDLKWLAVGVSGWAGKTFQPRDFATTPLTAGKTHDRQRLGADAQLYLDLVPFGATSVKAEFITGKTWTKSGVEQYGVEAMGGWGLLMQNLGLHNSLALRWDYFDPNIDKDNAVDSANAKLPSSSNVVQTLGVALIHHWDEVLKITAVYELPLTSVVASADDPEDNVFTLQLQAKF